MVLHVALMYRMCFAVCAVVAAVLLIASRRRQELAKAAALVAFSANAACIAGGVASASHPAAFASYCAPVLVLLAALAAALAWCDRGHGWRKTAVYLGLSVLVVFGACASFAFAPSEFYGAETQLGFLPALVLMGLAVLMVPAPATAAGASPHAPRRVCIAGVALGAAAIVAMLAGLAVGVSAYGIIYLATPIGSFINVGEWVSALVVAAICLLALGGADGFVVMMAGVVGVGMVAGPLGEPSLAAAVAAAVLTVLARRFGGGAPLGLCGILAVGAAAMLVAGDWGYRLNPASWIMPELDPYGAGWSIVQARMDVVAGLLSPAGEGFGVLEHATWAHLSATTPLRVQGLVGGLGLYALAAASLVSLVPAPAAAADKREDGVAAALQAADASADRQRAMPAAVIAVAVAAYFVARIVIALAGSVGLLPFAGKAPLLGTGILTAVAASGLVGLAAAEPALLAGLRVAACQRSLLEDEDILEDDRCPCMHRRSPLSSLMRRISEYVEIDDSDDADDFEEWDLPGNGRPVRREADL